MTNTAWVELKRGRVSAPGLNPLLPNWVWRPCPPAPRRPPPSTARPSPSISHTSSRHARRAVGNSPPIHPVHTACTPYPYGMPGGR